MFLQVGDVFEVKAGDRFYTSVLRGDKQGTMTVEVTVGKDISSGSTAHFAGEYVVVKARKSGGGYGHGPGDCYPDGHEVTAKKLNNGKFDPEAVEIRFYQSGCFTVVWQNDVQVLRKMKRKVTFE